MDSLTIDWLDENKYRAYPLLPDLARVSGLFTLEDTVILDAAFTFESLPTDTTLNSIVADGTDVVFSISGKTFTCPRASSFPNYLRIADGSLLVIGEVASIPNGSYSFSNINFEPSVSVEFGGPWLGVQSINFGSALTGELNFIEGYQFGINIVGQTISFSAGSQYGIPIGCTQFDETPSICADIISFINGVAPNSKNVLSFSRGNEVVILDDPDNSRIFIGLTFNPDDVCQPIPRNPEA